MVGFIEPLVHRAQERGWSRHRSTVTVVLAIAVCSVVSVLGYNVWSGAVIGDFDINTLLDVSYSSYHVSVKIFEIERVQINHNWVISNRINILESSFD